MHHPPHIYLDDTWYIITAATLNHAPLLSSDRAKALVRDKLKELIQEFKITLRASRMGSLFYGSSYACIRQWTSQHL